MNQNLFFEPPSDSNHRHKSRNTFGASLIVHGAVIALLIGISEPFAPGSEPTERSQTKVKLVTPHPSLWQELSRPRPRIQAPPSLTDAPKRAHLKLERQAAPEPERIELDQAPSVVAESRPQIGLPPAKLPEIAQPRIQIGGFSTASTDPERHKSKLKMAAAGFGAVSAGETRRAAPQATAAGFGAASRSAAVGKPTRRPSKTGFATVTAGKTSSAPAAPSSPGAYRPIRIMKKPQPVYTQEARGNKVEGDVRLEVIFGADGRLQVLKVVQGLGYGLDQAAIAAAQGIQFEAAKQFGRPVDITTTIHIRFQMAY